MNKSRILRIMGLAALVCILLFLGGTACADEYQYEAARSMLAMINDFRTGGNAWYWEADDTTYSYATGLSALSYDYELEAVAMLRACEIATRFSHTRPDGSKWSTAFPAGNYYKGENIASGFITAASAFEGFLEENEPYDGQGHRRNMLRPEYTRVGIGAVKVDGIMYWAQAFASGSVSSSAGTESNVSGWSQENGYHVYRNADGSKATGWLHDGGSWYYMDSSGYMQTGWLNLDGYWYYLQPSGALDTGWFQQGKDWYYADADGALQTGWQKIGGHWYHFEDGGALNVGWFKADGSWYYTDDSGVMQTGWQEIDGSWYYFKNSGEMAVGTVTIAGQRESFNSNGVWEGTLIDDYDTPLGTSPLIQLLRRILEFLLGFLET